MLFEEEKIIIVQNQLYIARPSQITQIFCLSVKKTEGCRAHVLMFLAMFSWPVGNGETI